MTIARVTQIEVLAGARPESGPRQLALSPVTVLVGPNNGGKSTALRDLKQFAQRGGAEPVPDWEGGTIFGDIQVDPPSTQEEALSFLDSRIHRIHGESIEVRSFQVPAAEQGVQVVRLVELDPSNYASDEVAAKLLSLHTISLDGPQRFQLALGTQSGALDNPPTSHWMAVAREPDIYDEVDQMIYAAFGKHLVIQTFRPPQLVPALSDDEQPLELRQSTSPEAIEAQRSAVGLEYFSDGVKAFCGLIAAVATLPHLLLLIDEPEAFLHPTLSRRLGADLARIARERNARLIAATHSAEFLLGCVEEVPQTTVLRLDYRSEVASSYVLQAEDVAALSRDPLLRSADALQALFSRSAVICEADSDRAFYSEINRRLSQTEGRIGAHDCDFLNAQNWQTTAKLAAPLRKAGVPAAVILDLDALAKDESWSELIAMGNPSDQERERLHAVRTAGRDAIRECGGHGTEGPLKVKTDGLDALSPEQRVAVEHAIDALAAVGVFLVDVGELENWLIQFGCTNKQRWVTDMLSRLGSSGDAAYVHPGNGDVWSFVERIATWLEDPARAGLPEL